jgi:SAM-dependent methyltransferase
MPAESSDPHQGFFSVWSRFYEATPLLGPLLRAQQDLALAHLAAQPRERILDLGCGPGRGLDLLRASRCKPLGLDTSAEMLRDASRSAPCVRASAMALPLRAGVLDGLLCTNSFHHYPEPLATLRELRRVLRPGGRLVLVDPNAESLAARLAIYGGEALAFGLDVHLHTRAQWRTMCRDAGFARCEVEKLGGRLGALAKGVPVAGRLAELAATSLLVAAVA